MTRILVIEDDPDLQTILSYNLRDAGHEVLVTRSGREGLALAIEHAPGLVLLDLMLPDLSGTKVCQELRRDPRTERLPVMMLTAKGEEVDRIVGFSIGADDYVTKPFSVRELILRIEAILRRSSGGAPGAGQVTTFGLLRIERDAHRVWVGDQEITTTALELKLLCALHDRKDRVLSRDTILDEVWGIDAHVTTRTIDTHIQRLREKLGQAGRYIETVRGVGYRFLRSPDGPE